LKFKITYFYFNIIFYIKSSASLLQSLVSHDPSEIILRWWFDRRNIYYYYQCWKRCGFQESKM